MQEKEVHENGALESCVASMTVVVAVAVVFPVLVVVKLSYKGRKSNGRCSCPRIERRVATLDDSR